MNKTVFEDINILNTKNKVFVGRIFINIGLYAVAVILAYNGYKELAKGYEHILSHFIGPYLKAEELSHIVKHRIHETIPWAIIIFAACITSYSILCTKKKRDEIYFSYTEYLIILFYVTLLTNLIFILRIHAVCILSLSLPCFFIALFILKIFEPLFLFIAKPLYFLIIELLFFSTARLFRYPPKYTKETILPFRERREHVKRMVRACLELLSPHVKPLLPYLEPLSLYVKPYTESLLVLQDKAEQNSQLHFFTNNSALVAIFYLTAAMLAYLPTIGDLLRSDHWFFLTLSRSDSSLLEIACFNMFGHPTFDLLRWIMFHWLDALFENNMVAYHLLSIATHAINGLLIFLITKTILGTSLFPFLVGLLFVVLASHFDTVSWSILFDFQISTFFCLLALLLLTKYIWSNLSIVNVYLAIFLSIIPVFLRECFIVSPVFIFSPFLLLSCFSEDNKRPHILRHTLLLSCGLIALYLLYFYGALVWNPNLKLTRTEIPDILTPQYIISGIYTTLVAITHMCFLNNLGIFTPEMDISCLVYLYEPELLSGWLKIPVLLLSLLALIVLCTRWSTWYFALPVLLLAICSYSIIGIGRMSTGGFDYIISRSHYAYFPNALFLISLGLLIWSPTNKIKKLVIYLCLLVFITFNFKNTYLLNTEASCAMNDMNTHYQRIQSFLEKNPETKLFLDFVPNNEGGRFGLGTEIAFDVLFPNKITKSVKKATHIYDSQSFRINNNYSPSSTNLLEDFTVQFFMCSNRPETLSKKVPVVGSESVSPMISLTPDWFIEIVLKDATNGTLMAFSAPYPRPLYRDFRGQDWTWIVVEKSGKELCFIFNGILRKKCHLDRDYLRWQEDGISLLGQYYRGVRQEVQVGRLFVKIDDSQYKSATQRVGFMLNVPIERYTQ